MKSFSFQSYYFERELDRGRNDPDSVWRYLCQLQEARQPVDVPALPPESNYEKIKQDVTQMVMDKLGDAALETTPGVVSNVLGYVFQKGGALLRRLFIRLPPKPGLGAPSGQLKDYELASRRRQETGERFGTMSKFLGGIAVAALYYALMMGVPYMQGRAAREPEVQQLQQKVQQLQKQVAALPPEQQQAGRKIAQEIAAEKPQAPKTISDRQPVGDRDSRAFFMWLTDKTVRQYRDQYAGQTVHTDGQFRRIEFRLPEPTMEEVDKELRFFYQKVKEEKGQAKKYWSDYWYGNDPDRLAELMARRIYLGQRNRMVRDMIRRGDHPPFQGEDREGNATE